MAGAGGKARRNNDGVAAGPPAWEAGTESIKPLSKQSCSVCSVGRGALEAGTHPQLNPSQAPSPPLCLPDSPLVARWRSTGCGADTGEPGTGASRALEQAKPLGEPALGRAGLRASWATGRGCTPGWLLCLHPHPVGLGPVILMKPRLQGQNQEWEESGEASVVSVT